MSFNVKITAIAATMLALALFLQTPTANAESNDSVRNGDSKSDKAVKEVKTKVVTVKPGDNLSSLADKYKTTWIRLYNANKGVANPDLIHPGDKIKVPKADQKLPNRYDSYVSDRTSAQPVAPASNLGHYNRAARPSNVSATAGNAYVWGQCTWYVKNMRPEIGSFWGNAGYSWIGSAQAAGFETGSAPRVGAIAVQAGHVAYVQAVNGDQVSVSEMNWNGGVGVVSYRTTSASNFAYIY